MSELRDFVVKNKPLALCCVETCITEDILNTEIKIPKYEIFLFSVFWMDFWRKMFAHSASSPKLFQDPILKISLFNIAF